MKQLFSVAFLATAAFLGLAQVSDAHGGLFRRGGCCETPACAPAAPAEVKWEERKVKVAKHKMVEKEIDVIECRRVVKDVPYSYTVCVPVVKEEKRKVIVCTPTMREVDATWTVMTPRQVEKKIQCTTWKCERVNVTEKVPVCRTVCVTYVDECGRCCTKRERVTEWVEQTRCVLKRTPIVEERTVVVTECVPVVHKGKKTICENVRSEKDVMVKVCTYDRKEMKGVRQECSIEHVKAKRKVQVCETYFVEETIRVQVGGACCESDCGRRSFFRRGCCN